MARRTFFSSAILIMSHLPCNVHLPCRSKQPEHWKPKTSDTLDSLESLFTAPFLSFMR